MKKLFFLFFVLFCTKNAFCSNENNHVKRKSSAHITVVFSTPEKRAQFYNENLIGIEAYLAVMSGLEITEKQARAIERERKKQ